MGTIKRLNEQKDKLTQAESAMPGAYDDRYDQAIQDTVSAMGSQNSTGFDFNSQNKDYRGALSRLFGNQGAAADAAAQVAQGLSGGYGADWAKSAADQSAASGVQDAAAGVMAKARADALTQWQQELAGQSSQLDTLLGQDSLERGEYDGKVKAAQNWRGYQHDRTEQARQENSDFWSNIWNAVQMVGENALLGYQRYLGYDQWKQEFNYQQERDAKQDAITDLSNKVAGMQQAASFEKAGMHDAAQATLDMYNIDKTMFDNWQGLTDADKEWFDYASKVQDLGANGYDKLMGTAAEKFGYDTSSFESYDELSQKQIRQEAARQAALNDVNLNYYGSQLALQNRYKTAGTGSSTSRSSGTKSGTSSGSTKNSSGFTTSQLQTMAKEFKSMKETDPLYSFYKQSLTDAGWLSGGTSSGNTGNWGSSPLSGTGNPGKVNGTAYEQGMYRARQWANNGFTIDQIAQKLANETGLSNDLISSIMNQIEYEWQK